MPNSEKDKTQKANDTTPAQAKPTPALKRQVSTPESRARFDKLSEQMINGLEKYNKMVKGEE